MKIVVIVEGSEEGEGSTGTSSVIPASTRMFVGSVLETCHGIVPSFWVALEKKMKDCVRMDHAVLEMWTGLRRIGEIRRMASGLKYRHTEIHSVH